jgi:hypothetical protein
MFFHPIQGEAPISGQKDTERVPFLTEYSTSEKYPKLVAFGTVSSPI